jgi:DNA recombination protein RmuC
VTAETTFLAAVALALLAVVALAVVVALTAVWRRRADAAAGAEAARRAVLDGEIARLREGRTEAERRLAAEERTTARVPELERELVERDARIDGLREAKARADESLAQSTALLAEKSDAVDRLRREIEIARASQDAARAEAADLRARMAALQETLEQERRQAGEKLALLNEAREAMSREFKALAEEVMKNHGETFSRQNREQVEGVLTPLREKLTEFQQGLQHAHTESARDRATLAEQIRQLTDQSAKMSSETHNLTRALKGETQVQGAWGEMILGTILERSGLREGEEYVTQESVVTGAGARLRPDVVVNLPNGERIVIDSKVSLTAFEACVNAEAEAARASHLARHLQSMRAHIRGLGSKDYHAISGSALDYVIMFVPIEGALAAALQADPALTAYAAEHNVAIATPTTLMIALRTVANVWQVERRNRNAEAIAARAGALYDKFHGFAVDMQRLGSQLATARGTYDDAMKKLSTGSGNLVRQAEMLRAMGAKTGKVLPIALLEDTVDEVVGGTKEETDDESAEDTVGAV